MASLLETLAALATAGTMMISSSLDAAAPQNDVDGFLFLQNRSWLARTSSRSSKWSLSIFSSLSRA